MPLFGREKRWSKKKRDAGGGAGVWQVRLHLLSNGYIVMARLLSLVPSDTRTCSHTHTHTHTNLRQRLDQSFLLPLKLLPNLCLSHIHTALLLPPHPHASSILLPQTKVRSRQTDNQTRARSVHKISVRTHPRHTLTYMMSRIHLPWQPNNEPR